MKSRLNRGRKADPQRARFFLRVGLAAFATLLAAGASDAQSSTSVPRDDKPMLASNANHPANGGQQTAPGDTQSNAAAVPAGEVAQKRQIADDSALLLKLASDLKAEVDKTSKDTLSLGVIRKAQEIEKLAHSVKEKMKVMRAD